jgi:hypothetical protein
MAVTFIAGVQTANWNQQTATQTSPSITVQVGDVVVLVGMSEDSTDTLYTPTNSNTAQTWTLKQSIVVASFGTTYVWTTTVTTAQSMTMTVTSSSGSRRHGVSVFQFRGATGVGTTSKTNSTGAPSLGITTASSNSAVVVAWSDWAAIDVATRAYRTGAGAFTEQTAVFVTGTYSVYAGYHANAGTAGALTVGATAPTGQSYAIVAVEVQGAAAAPVSVPVLKSQAINRASRW